MTSTEGGLTGQQWVTLFCIGSVHFCAAICVSIQAPFYPQEAEAKGATVTEHGLVFGSFELTAFLVSPALGKYVDKIGPKTVLNSGIVVAAASCILFGLLHLLQGRWLFIGLSFLLRIVESMGASAATVAAFSITAAAFPSRVATTFATLEIFYGLGFIVGPLIGSLLYSVGGFVLPFAVMGGVLLCDGLLIFCAMPKVTAPSMDKSKGKVLKVLRVPDVLLDSFSIAATSISMGFYQATLEPHLRQFELSALVLGLMFVLSGLMYMLSAPLVGRLCDSRVHPKRLIGPGSAAIIASYLLVGPMPFVRAQPKLWMCIVGLLIHGIGMALILVPCFIDALREALARGFPDDITTYGIISGLWLSTFSLGACIGPSIAGALYDSVGFSLGSLATIGLHLVVMVVSVVFASRGARPQQRGGAAVEEAAAMLEAGQAPKAVVVAAARGGSAEQVATAPV
ncbi:MFS-type transporter SLC18B1-like [Bacillus rossius redtenbacheri]|uniref:MFS-type transporter SLC18B1-like n=1 Tax=Bacillus rossius redtenbacheri TaxID=93214 RepID=UPI002FDD072B